MSNRGHDRLSEHARQTLLLRTDSWHHPYAQGSGSESYSPDLEDRTLLLLARSKQRLADLIHLR
jgi:hypothetical protein